MAHGNLTGPVLTGPVLTGPVRTGPVLTGPVLKRVRRSPAPARLVRGKQVGCGPSENLGGRVAKQALSLHAPCRDYAGRVDCGCRLCLVGHHAPAILCPEAVTHEPDAASTPGPPTTSMPTVMWESRSRPAP